MSKRTLPVKYKFAVAFAVHKCETIGYVDQFGKFLTPVRKKKVLKKKEKK